MRSKNQSQQILLRFLGFYQGKCDGIWGPDSVAAKRKYEASESYTPGIPSNGMPFTARGPIPKGVYRVPCQPGFLRHIDMPDGYEKELLSELVTEDAARKLHDAKHCQSAPVHAEQPSSAPQAQVESPVEAPVTSPVEAQAASTEEVPVSVETPDAREAVRRDMLRRQQQSSNQHKHRHNK